MPSILEKPPVNDLKYTPCISITATLSLALRRFLGVSFHGQPQVGEYSHPKPSLFTPNKPHSCTSFPINKNLEPFRLCGSNDIVHRNNYNKHLLSSLSTLVTLLISFHRIMGLIFVEPYNKLVITVTLKPRK